MNDECSMTYDDVECDNLLDYLSGNESSELSKTYTMSSSGSSDFIENDYPLAFVRTDTQDTIRIFENLIGDGFSSDEDERRVECPVKIEPIVVKNEVPKDLSVNGKLSTFYLNDSKAFMRTLLVDVASEKVKDVLRQYENELHCGVYFLSPRTLKEVIKDIFSSPKKLKDYVQKVKQQLDKAKARNHLNDLKMKIFAITVRHLIIESGGVTMTKDEFTTMFRANIEEFQYEELNKDSEIEFLFRCLIPVIIFCKNDFKDQFFNRKSGLLLALGTFMEFSGRQYTSGGGKTLPTLLREACMDQITGNQRSTRNRKSKAQAKMGCTPKRNSAKKNNVKKAKVDSDSEFEPQYKKAKELLTMDSDSESEDELIEDRMDCEYRSALTALNA